MNPPPWLKTQRIEREYSGRNSERSRAQVELHLQTCTPGDASDSRAFISQTVHAGRETLKQHPHKQRYGVATVAFAIVTTASRASLLSSRESGPCRRKRERSVQR